MNRKIIFSIMVIFLLIGPAGLSDLKATSTLNKRYDDYYDIHKDELSCNKDEVFIQNNYNGDNKDKTPTKEEKNFFDILLKRLNANPKAIPNKPKNGKVDDASKSLEPTKWEKTWDCKNPPPAKCQVIVQTKLVKWCTSDNKPKDEDGNYTVSGWTEAKINVDKTIELKKMTITVELELDPESIREDESNPPGQVKNVGLLYHELLHIQMMIDEIKSEEWQDNFCKCIDNITDFPKHHTVINDLQSKYEDNLWKIITDRMDDGKEPWTVCSKTGSAGSNHIIASPFAEVIVDISLKQDSIVNIVQGSGNCIAGYNKELVNTLDPIKTYKISVLDIRENISSVYTENVTWPISVMLYYNDDEIPYGLENNLGIFSKINDFWVYETDSQVNNVENYIKADIYNLDVLSLGLHGKTVYVDHEGGADFDNIQEAIDYASPGDRIHVYDGTYNENIRIDKNIDLEGEYSGIFNPLNKATVINGDGIGNVITVNADNVDIHGFIIQNCGNLEEDAGIDIRTNNNTVFGNVISNNEATGIYLHDSACGNIIYGNDLINNGGAGIFIWESSYDNIILNNNLADNSWFNAKDKCDNIWDYGYPICGNYWSDYSGNDYNYGPYQNISGSDGIGDTPYEILDDKFDGDNKDTYPFMNLNGWNKPPNSPIITGKVQGNPGTDYQYDFYITEHLYQWFTLGLPQVYLYVDWGDGRKSSWLGPYVANDIVSLSHNWSEKGNYVVKAKTKDNYGLESNWTTLAISMPKIYVYNPIIQLLLKMLEHFPFLEKIQNQLL